MHIINDYNDDPEKIMRAAAARMVSRTLFDHPEIAKAEEEKKYRED